MGRSTGDSEQRWLREVAREYEVEGYRVVRRPSGADLPDFLSGHRPALLAYGDDENVVVDVRPRGTLVGATDLVALAEAVEAAPGWRLNLALKGPRGKRGTPAREELSAAAILERVAAARHLAAIEQEEAALLIVWSGLEALLRLTARRYDVVPERDNPAVLIEQLIWEGALDREYYETLERGLRERNALAHGYQTPDQLGDLVRALAKAAERTLAHDAPALAS